MDGHVSGVMCNVITRFVSGDLEKWDYSAIKLCVLPRILMTGQRFAYTKKKEKFLRGFLCAITIYHAN